MIVQLDQVQAAFDYAYRAGSDAVWANVEGFVSDVPATDDEGVVSLGVRVEDLQVGAEVDVRRVRAASGELLEAAAQAAVTAERLATLALGCGEPADADLAVDLDLADPSDGRPAVTEGARFGSEEGQIVTLPAGTSLLDDRALRAAFLEARARLWANLEHVGHDIERITSYTVILSAEAHGALLAAADPGYGPLRIGLSRVRVFRSPRVASEAFVIANFADWTRRAFELRVREHPNLVDLDGAVGVGMRVGFRITNAAAIARIQPSALVLAGSAREARLELAAGVPA